MGLFNYCYNNETIHKIKDVISLVNDIQSKEK